MVVRIMGWFNIVVLNLKEILVEVMKMYDLESIGVNDGSWVESVDVICFVVVDNEFEILDDFIFLDYVLSDLDDDSDGLGNIFGGLENFDLYNNLLVNVFLGFCRFNYLIFLNLVSLFILEFCFFINLLLVF